MLPNISQFNCYFTTKKALRTTLNIKDFIALIKLYDIEDNESKANKVFYIKQIYLWFIFDFVSKLLIILKYKVFDNKEFMNHSK